MIGRDKGFHLWLREHGIEPHDTCEVEIAWQADGKHGTIRATAVCRDSKGKLIFHPYIEDHLAYQTIEKVISSELVFEGAPLARRA